jgi:formylglycine-generating enzyme required for sulfatase activity
VAAGVYPLGDGGERVVELRRVLIGRWPVAAAHVRRFVETTSRPVSAALRDRPGDEQLADHPATEVTFADAVAFCAWASSRLGRRVRLPTGDEWEAAARGRDGRIWPWGDVFDLDRCNSAESGWGWTVPVRSHPTGASASGAEQMAGQVWEWVGDRADDDGWRTVRGALTSTPPGASVPHEPYVLIRSAPLRTPDFGSQSKGARSGERRCGHRGSRSRRAGGRP